MDVSHNNGIVNWEKAKEEGIEFAFIRAMFGYNKDKQFDRNWSEAKRVGIARGAYSWIIHGFDPIKTAKLAVDCISHDLGELPPVVDFENTKYYGKPTFAELKKYINEINYILDISRDVYNNLFSRRKKIKLKLTEKQEDIEKKLRKKLKYVKFEK